MTKFIDDFLNKITMYRLMLYYLIALLILAGFYSLIKTLPFNFFALSFSVAFLITASWVTNFIFSKIFRVPPNIESVYITALILALIITPVKSFADLQFLFIAAFLAQASKYLLAFHKKHIFNPAAFGVGISSYIIGQSASWWVGNVWMMPAVLVGGVLIVRKIKRGDLVLSFIFVSLLMILFFAFFRGVDLFNTLKITILYSPLLFLAFVMLTEPVTTPPTKKLRLGYGTLVGFFFNPQLHLGNFYFASELALLIGNIYSYLVSPKARAILKLKEKIALAPDIYDFIFDSGYKPNFTPGQYLEWNLKHENPDSRGNRRYFTIASSPTEQSIRVGVKFAPQASSFKKSLSLMKIGDEILAGQLAGDFTLPKDDKKKMIFIAGGIGITPFRSMIKYLLDTKQKRDIVLFYSNRTVQEFVYRDIVKQAEKELGIKSVYVVTDLDEVPKNWPGKKGHINEEVIKQEVPDFSERIFYLSGPHGMVTAFEEVLKKIGIPRDQIKTDYFPGYV